MNHPQITSDQWKYLTAVLDHLANTEDDISHNAHGGWDFAFEHGNGGMYDETLITASCAGFTGESYVDRCDAEDDWLRQVHLYFTSAENTLNGWTAKCKYGKE